MSKNLENAPGEVLTVCGGKISNPDAYPSSVFKGQQHFFCTASCLEIFLQDPIAFLAGKVEHPDE